MSERPSDGGVGGGTRSRAVLVTGGTGTLGAVVRDRFLEDGHRVVATSRPGDSPQMVTGGDGHPAEGFHLFQSDVTQQSSVGELVHQTIAKLGTIEVLVHLVGGWAGGDPLQNTSLETWERMFALNLRSAFLCSRAVLPVMREQRWGRLVFVSAEAAQRGRRHQGAYAIAKAGVTVLAETIAEENEDLDVTANVVGPSALDTPVNRAARGSADPSSLVPLEDVAKMIAFLASEEAGQLRGAWLPAFGRA